MSSRLLKIDPRPPGFASVAEALVDDEAAALVDDAVEMSAWAPVTPQAPSTVPRLAFVDGVQQTEARLMAEGDAADGWPAQGRVVSYAAGAICPGQAPAVRHVRVERRVMLGRGRIAETLTLDAHNGAFVYGPISTAGDDTNALEQKLGELRAELEADVVRDALEDGCDLVVVDGRLPPITGKLAVGLIKTPARVPLNKDEQMVVLNGLDTGQRSPVFVRQRSDRRYYSWFVCLRKPGRYDLSLSGLALLEMDDSPSIVDARRIADMTASVLPQYASTPQRDDRAPQNLLPVGQLERDLRHRLGDADFLRRLMVKAFEKEERAWT